MADVNKNGIVAPESCTSKKCKDSLKEKFTNEEMQKLRYLQSKEPVLFQCLHKDYFEKDTKLSSQ